MRISASLSWKRVSESENASEREAYRKLLNQAQLRVQDWGKLRREYRIAEFDPLIEKAIDHLCKILDLDLPKPIQIHGKVLAECLVDVLMEIKREYQNDEQKAAAALGIPDFGEKVEQLKKQIKRQKNTSEQQKKLSGEPQQRSSEFPETELDAFAKMTVFDFLGMPTTRFRINRWSLEERLRVFRIALSIFLDRMRDCKGGIICMGGMSLEEIENEIYRQVASLYDTRQDQISALGRDSQTIREALVKIGLDP